MTETIAVINIDSIKKLIPHRAPMLLIDRVENVIPDREATGIKAVSGNEPFFEGVMISTSGQQGLSFSTQGIRVN